MIIFKISTNNILIPKWKLNINNYFLRFILKINLMVFFKLKKKKNILILFSDEQLAIICGFQLFALKIKIICNLG